LNKGNQSGAVRSSDASLTVHSTPPSSELSHESSSSDEGDVSPVLPLKQTVTVSNQNKKDEKSAQEQAAVHLELPATKQRNSEPKQQQQKERTNQQQQAQPKMQENPQFRHVQMGGSTPSQPEPQREEGPRFRQVITQTPSQAPNMMPMSHNDMMIPNDAGTAIQLRMHHHPSMQRMETEQSTVVSRSDTKQVKFAAPEDSMRTPPSSPSQATARRAMSMPSMPDFTNPKVAKCHVKACLNHRTQRQKESLLELYHEQQHQHNRLLSKQGSSSSMNACSNNSGARIMPSDRPRTFVVLSGPSGTGKSRLVQETLQEQVEVRDGGYFLQGKYDSLRRPVPYQAFVTAFSSFTAQVQQRGPEHVATMRQAILRELGQEGDCASVGDNKFVLASMIPALQSILGGCAGDTVEQAAARYQKSSNENPIQRFIFAFRMFMRAIANPQHPVVLVLQNLHNADPCSLDILTGIATMSCPPGLVLIGTVDDSMVRSKSYLASKLREMEDSGMTYVASLAMPPLFQEISEIEDVLQQALQIQVHENQRNAETLSRLARLVLRQTNGNSFQIVEFLHWLQDSDFLTYYPNSDCNSMGNWDLSSQEDMEVTFSLDQPGDFLMDKIIHLSHESKQVIKVCSCLGSTIDPEILEYVLDYAGVEKVLDDFVKRGLLTVRHNNSTFGSAAQYKYMFEHDGIQQAAYKSIPEAERELFHLEIGRRLWRKLSTTQLDDKLFVVLSQMYVGRRLITREKERFAIASLCLHAGKKAAKSSTFRLAALYLQMGIGLLDTKTSWFRSDEYDLTLALYCAAAEMELCCARFEAAKQLLENVFRNARSFEDKLQAYTTKMYVLSQNDEQQECMDLGLWLLQQMNEDFPNRLCNAHLLGEFRSVERLLKGKSNEQILRMPHISNTNKLNAMQVLNFMVLPAILHRPKLAPFVYLKCMKITLLYGNSVFAAGAYSTYGMLCVGATGDVEKGARYAKLALQSLEQYKVYEYLPRVYAAVYGVIHAWTKPMKGALEPLLHAYRVGMQTGDAEYGGLCANLYCWHALHSGTPLQSIRKEYNGFKETLVASRQTYLVRQFLPTMQTLHHLMGISDDPLAAKGDLMDFDEYEKEATERGTISDVGSLKYCKMQLGYIFCDTELAEKNVLGCDEVMLLPPSFERVDVVFYMALIFIQVAHEGRNYWKHVFNSRRIISWIKKYCHKSPHNLLDKLNLVLAEYASLTKGKEAYEKYVTAIAVAHEKGNLGMLAICNERFARHLLRQSTSKKNKFNIAAAEEYRDKAKVYMKRAAKSYRDWGAMAKMNRLIAEAKSIYGPNMCSEESEFTLSPAIGGRTESGLSCARC